MASDDRQAAEARFGEWMAAAQRGDQQAYERLLRELLPAVRAFVRHLLRDDASTEDVVQNVLLQIHRARHTYRPERPFGPWLRAISRNAALDALRARVRRGRREVAGLEPEQAEAMAGAAAFAQTMPEREERLVPPLRDALAALPASQREALLLLHVEELSVREAAERVGTTPGALKLRAHRALQALRAALGRDSQ